MSDELKQSADHYSEVEEKVAELKEKLSELTAGVQETVEREDRKYSIPDFKQSKEAGKTGETVTRTLSGTVGKLEDFYDRNLKETVESAAGKAKSAAVDAYNTLSLKISDLRAGAKEAAEESLEEAAEAVEEAKQEAEETAGEAKEAAEEAKESAEEKLNEAAGRAKEKFAGLAGIDVEELKNSLAETGAKVRSYAEQAYKNVSEKFAGKDPEDPKDPD
ncbi:MAG: hypothetical protein Q4D24_07480 [Erysipelotrichaceae bacterium]|nr:hypothetical protein [Erysipelotrichaceae bacterium]